MRRRTATAIAGGALLAGCIPQVAPPVDYGRGRAPVSAQPMPESMRIQPLPTAPRREQTREAQAAARPIGRGVAAPPSAPPAWEARPVTADARDVPAGSYVVRPGDTLRGVAASTGAGADAIAQANGIAPPYVIAAGQRLRIPAGRYHLVLPGQTGIAIARAYGVEWSQIVSANGLTEPYILRAGQRILIPGFEPGAPPRSLAERAAAFQLDVDDILTGGEPAPAEHQAAATPVVTPKRVLPSTALVVAPVHRSGAFLWPVNGTVTDRFGPGRTGVRNDGIQIAVPIDTPIKAAADGVVAYSGDGVAALGGLVILKHGDGWTTVYGHASKLLVTRGQSVKRGQTIALSGDTGFADRPSLHFEIRRGRDPVDPLSQLPSS